jgi:hypothetical protein
LEQKRDRKRVIHLRLWLPARVRVDFFDDSGQTVTYELENRLRRILLQQTVKHSIHNHEFRVPTIQRMDEVVDQTVKLTLRIVPSLLLHTYARRLGFSGQKMGNRRIPRAASVHVILAIVSPEGPRGLSGLEWSSCPCPAVPTLSSTPLLPAFPAQHAGLSS